jgi:hypothetical protein
MFYIKNYIAKINFNIVLPTALGARGGVVGWGTTLQTGTSRVRFPMVSLELIPWHNRFGRTMALGV